MEIFSENTQENLLSKWQAESFGTNIPAIQNVVQSVLSITRKEILQHPVQNHQIQEQFFPQAIRLLNP